MGGYGFIFPVIKQNITFVADIIENAKCLLNRLSTEFITIVKAILWIPTWLVAPLVIPEADSHLALILLCILSILPV